MKNLGKLGVKNVEIDRRNILQKREMKQTLGGCGGSGSGSSGGTCVFCSVTINGVDNTLKCTDETDENACKKKITDGINKDYEYLNLSISINSCYIGCCSGNG